MSKDDGIVFGLESGDPSPEVRSAARKTLELLRTAIPGHSSSTPETGTPPVVAQLMERLLLLHRTHTEHVTATIRQTVERDVLPALAKHGCRLVDRKFGYVVLRQGRSVSLEDCRDPELLDVLRVLETSIPGFGGLRIGDLGFQSKMEPVETPESPKAMRDEFVEAWKSTEVGYHTWLEARVGDICKAHVWPLLKRRKYQMLVGNGTFLILDRNGKQLPSHRWAFHDLVDVSGSWAKLVERDPDYAQVLEILHLELPGSNGAELGSWAPEFPPDRGTH